MSLRIRFLRLRAQTGQGMFGADIPLSDGLMVVRAENSRGKTTSVHSILYALGLERMITTTPRNALTSAMRDRLIFDPSTKAETEVLSSWISIEIEGADGQIATITRWVTDANRDANLVRVHLAPMTNIDSTTPSTDLFVGRGSASRDAGFHVWLAEFMGWQMPVLPASQGRTAPLYIEQVFPLLFVEQRRGWGGIQAQMPMFSGVTEVRKRAVEFLLGLDLGQYELEKQRLRAAEAQLAEDWRVKVRSFASSLERTGLLAIGLPEKLQVVWPNATAPAVLAQAGEGDTWAPVEVSLGLARVELGDLEEQAAVADSFTPALPTREDAAKVSSRTIELLDVSRSLRTADLGLREELLRDEEELNSIDRRLDSLRRDLREHEDVVKLQDFGSDIDALLSDDCPVCHQALPATLLPADVHSMSPTESVDYIKQQIDLFTAMRDDTERALAARREQWVALRNRSDDVALQLAALRETLVGRDARLSGEVLARRVQLRDEVRHLEAAQERFDELEVGLAALAARAAEVRSQLKALPKDELSDDDRAKLRALQRSFVTQLKLYDFGSFANEMIDISSADYLPRRDQFDLQADISASDSVRVIWAYLLGLLEVGEQLPTNHPGILVFDEPKQQSAKDLSFAALLRRAAANPDRRQVIFATSEKLESLTGMLADVPHHLHVIDGYLLKPMGDQ